MPRIQELDILQNQLPRGRWNSLTDVAGVLVGHYTLIAGNGEWQPGPTHRRDRGAGGAG